MVDRPRLVAEGYGQARERVLRRLGVETVDPSGGVQGILFSVGSEVGAAIGAVPFATVSDAPLLADVRAALVDDAGPDASDDQHYEVRVVDACGDLYDFGVGVLTVTYEIRMPRGASVAGFRDWSAAFRADVERQNSEPVRALAERFNTAVDEELTQPLFASPPSGAPVESRPAEAAWLSFARRLLWIHTVFVSETPRDRGRSDLLDELSEVIPSHAGCVDTAGCSICPGNLVSVAVHDGRPASCADAAALRTIVRAMNAWWTAVWELDRLLFSFLNEFNISSRKVVAAGLQAQAQRIESLHEHVRLFRTLLDTDLLNRSGRERRVWDAAATVWWFEENLSATERKIDALRELQSTLSNELATRRANRLDTMIAFFTVFAVLGSVTQIAAFLDPQLGESQRTSLAVGVLLLTIAALAASMWNRPFTRGRDIRVANRDVPELTPGTASDAAPPSTTPST